MISRIYIRRVGTFGREDAHQDMGPITSYNDAPQKKHVFWGSHVGGGNRFFAQQQFLDPAPTGSRCTSSDLINDLQRKKTLVFLLGCGFAVLYFGRVATRRGSSSREGTKF